MLAHRDTTSNNSVKRLNQNGQRVMNDLNLLSDLLILVLGHFSPLLSLLGSVGNVPFAFFVQKKKKEHSAAFLNVSQDFFLLQIDFLRLTSSPPSESIRPWFISGHNSFLQFCCVLKGHRGLGQRPV